MWISVQGRPQPLCGASLFRRYDQLAPPARLAKVSLVSSPQSFQIYAATSAALDSAESSITVAAADLVVALPKFLSSDRWLWRASWPRRDTIAKQAGVILAESGNAHYLEAVLQSISRLSRPENPFECADILEEFGAARDEVMSFLARLGLVLRRP